MVVALKPSKGWAAARKRGNRWKGGPRSGGGFSQVVGWVFQDRILDHVSEIDPRSKDQICEALANDYGSFELRTFHRNLAKLIASGHVGKELEYNMKTGNMEPVYRRLRRDLPDPSIRPPRRKRGKMTAWPVRHDNPVGPWPGYLVVVGTRHDTGRREPKVNLGGRISPTWPTAGDLLKNEARRASAKSPGSRPPGASANPPARPPEAARRAR